MALEHRGHVTRLHVLQRGKELANVSAACQEEEISRTHFYRWKRRFTLYGIDALHPSRTAARPGRHAELDSTKERKIIVMALAHPTWGPNHLSLQLKQDSVTVSPTTIWRTLHRFDWEREPIDFSLLRYTAPRAPDSSQTRL